MTPAIRLLKQADISYRVHQYTHDSAKTSYGLEAAQKLGIEAERVLKTLVVKLDSGALAVGLVPVRYMLGLKAMAKAAGAKKCVMASPSEVERATGYVLGGVSPLGQKLSLKTYIADSAQLHSTVFVSGGRRGLEIEIAPMDLAKLLDAQFASIIHR